MPLGLETTEKRSFQDPRLRGDDFLSKPLFPDPYFRPHRVDDTQGFCATKIVWRLPLPGRAHTVRNWTLKPVFLSRCVNS